MAVTQKLLNQTKEAKELANEMILFCCEIWCRRKFVTAAKNKQHMGFTVWPRLEAAVNITQWPAINTLKLCQEEAGVDTWHIQAQDFNTEVWSMPSKWQCNWGVIRIIITQFARQLDQFILITFHVMLETDLKNLLFFKTHF